MWKNTYSCLDGGSCEDEPVEKNLEFLSEREILSEDTLFMVDFIKNCFDILPYMEMKKEV